MSLHKNRIAFCLLLTTIGLASCGLFKKKQPPPPPEPTRVVLEFETAGDINPNIEDRSSPLVLRIYQLKSYSVFNKADFFSLFDKEDQTLAGQLTGKEEIMLKPNEKRTVYFETQSDTRTIGIMGLFINSENTRWKASAGIRPNKTTVIRVQVNGTGLAVR